MINFEQLAALKASVPDFCLKSYARKLSTALEVHEATPEARAIAVDLMLDLMAFLEKPVQAQPLPEASTAMTEPSAASYGEPTLAELAAASDEYAAYYADVPELEQLFVGLSHAAQALELRANPHHALLQATATVQCRLRNVLQERKLTFGRQVQQDMYHMLCDLARPHGFLNNMQLSSQPTSQAALSACRLLSRAITLPKQKQGKSLKNTPQRQTSLDVPFVRDALAGGEILIIGSDVSNQPFLEKCRDLGLKVRWQTFKHSQSVHDLEAAIRQPNVRVVVCAIRWVAHAVGEAKNICATHNRLFVRLPAGYNPNVLCYHIASQVGERLSRRKAA